MNSMEVNPRKYWVITPCFLKCLFLPEKNEDSVISKNIAFLLLQRKAMNVVFDVGDEFDPSVLFAQYKEIRKSLGPQDRKFFGEWIQTLNKKLGGIKPVKMEEECKFPNEFDAILSKAKTDSPKALECFINCIKLAYCSKDNLLLTTKERPMPIRNDRIDKELGLWVFNREGAEKFISCSENFDSSAYIQEALMTNFLLNIKHRIEKLQDIKLLYKNYRANGPIEPCIEEHIGERLFNDLDVLIGNCNLNCDREVKLGNAKLDAVISSGRHKVVIELKYAHRDIEHGLSQQLPDYLDRKDTIYGIFLILLFDNDRERIEEKKAELEKIKQKYAKKLSKYKIETYWINCSRKLPPSKLKTLDNFS